MGRALPLDELCECGCDHFSTLCPWTTSRPAISFIEVFRCWTQEIPSWLSVSSNFGVEFTSAPKFTLMTSLHPRDGEQVIFLLIGEGQWVQVSSEMRADWLRIHIHLNTRCKTQCFYWRTWWASLFKVFRFCHLERDSLYLLKLPD